MRYLFVVLMTFGFSAPQGYASTNAEAKKILEEMTLIYSQVQYMKANFKKTSESSLLGTKEKTKGKLEYSQKKFRLDVTSDPKSTFIKGSKSYWLINGDDVTTGDAGSAVPSVFESIFSDVSVWSKLNTKVVEQKKDVAQIEVGTNNEVPNVSKMTLYIDTSKKTLLRLTYTDDVNNVVDISLSSTRFFNDARPERFTYKIKKSDKVNKI